MIQELDPWGISSILKSAKSRWRKYRQSAALCMPCTAPSVRKRNYGSRILNIIANAPHVVRNCMPDISTGLFCWPADVQLRPVTSMASGFLSQGANWFLFSSWIFVNPSTCWIDVGAHRIWQAVIVFWTALMFTNARFFIKLGFTDMLESNSQAETLHEWPASTPFSDLICVLELCTKIQKGKCLHVSRPSWSFVGRCGL